MEPVIIIPALSDNFAYLFRYQNNKAIAIDPADPSPVLNQIKNHNLKLTAVLTTHHHADHTAGAKELKQKTNCTTITDNQNFTNGQTLNFDSCTIKIITTPGHTADSACFYIPQTENNNGILFTGDTLFIAGCGRPIENNPATMWHSLQKLTALPDSTFLYPGHDYTKENYQFALTIEPRNKTIQKLLEDISQNQGKSAVPSTIALEKQTNVFLRADTPEIKTAVNMPNATDAEAFAELRRRKNIFG